MGSWLWCCFQFPTDNVFVIELAKESTVATLMVRHTAIDRGFCVKHYGFCVVPLPTAAEGETGGEIQQFVTVVCEHGQLRMIFLIFQRQCGYNAKVIKQPAF